MLQHAVERGRSHFTPALIAGTVFVVYLVKAVLYLAGAADFLAASSIETVDLGLQLVLWAVLLVIAGKALQSLRSHNLSTGIDF